MSQGGTPTNESPGRDAPGATSPERPADRVTSARLRVYGLTWLSYMSYYLTRKNFSVAKKRIERELGITRMQLGWIDTGYLVTYAVGMMAWGLVADRVGAKRVLVAGMVATCICSLLFGWSSAFVVFAVVFGINGLAQSTGWPGNVKAMASWVPAERRGAVMGLWSTNYQVGSLVANPVATFLAIALGWRAAFHYPALGVGAVALLLLFLPHRPGPEGARPSGGEAVPAGQTTQRSVLRVPLVWVLGASYFFMKLTRYVLLFWLPYFMEDALGYAPALAGNVPLAFEAGGMVGAVTLGWASDRLTPGRRVPLSIVALVGLAVALPVYAWAAPHGLGANIASLALVGFCLFGPDSLLSGAAAQDVGGAGGAGAAAGVINSLGSVGPILSGSLTAIVSKSYGWGALFTMLGGGALCAALILVGWSLVSRRRPPA